MANDDPSTASRTVRLNGDYDVARQDELRSELLASTDNVVVADLRDVSFLDSSAIHAFVDARNQLMADGRDIQLINLTGMPRRVFDITGLTPLFTGAHPLDD